MQTTNRWERFESKIKPEEINVKKQQIIKLKPGVYDAVLSAIAIDEDKNGCPKLAITYTTVEMARMVKYAKSLVIINGERKDEYTMRNTAEAVNIIEELQGAEIPFPSLGAIDEAVANLSESGLGKQVKIKVSYDSRGYMQVALDDGIDVAPRASSGSGSTPPPIIY